MSPEAPVWPQHWIISVHFEFIVCIITTDWNNYCFLTLVCYQNKTWITDVPDSWNTSGEDLLNGQLWPNPSIKDRHQPLHNCWCSHPDRCAIFFCVRVSILPESSGIELHRTIMAFVLKLMISGNLGKTEVLNCQNNVSTNTWSFKPSSPRG